MITRRSILRGTLALLAAPAIVKVSSLMPVKALPGDILGDLCRRLDDLRSMRASLLRHADHLINPPLLVTLNPPDMQWFTLTDRVNIFHGYSVYR